MSSVWWAELYVYLGLTFSRWKAEMQMLSWLPTVSWCSRLTFPCPMVNLGITDISSLMPQFRTASCSTTGVRILIKHDAFFGHSYRYVGSQDMLVLLVSKATHVTWTSTLNEHAPKRKVTYPIVCCCGLPIRLTLSHQVWYSEFKHTRHRRIIDHLSDWSFYVVWYW